MEIDINSDEHKISNNKLRYYFDDITKFENNKVSFWNVCFVPILKILNQIIQCELNMMVFL